MKTITTQPTAEEIAAAYRKARLRYIGVSLLKALNTPSIYQSLVLQAQAMRDAAEQQSNHHHA